MCISKKTTNCVLPTIHSVGSLYYCIKETVSQVSDGKCNFTILVTVNLSGKERTPAFRQNDQHLLTIWWVLFTFAPILTILPEQIFMLLLAECPIISSQVICRCEQTGIYWHLVVINSNCHYIHKVGAFILLTTSSSSKARNEYKDNKWGHIQQNPVNASTVRKPWRW